MVWTIPLFDQPGTEGQPTSSTAILASLLTIAIFRSPLKRIVADRDPGCFPRIRVAVGVGSGAVLACLSFFWRRSLFPMGRELSSWARFADRHRFQLPGLYWLGPFRVPYATRARTNPGKSSKQQPSARCSSPCIKPLGIGGTGCHWHFRARLGPPASPSRRISLGARLYRAQSQCGED
jgi:hypothetical protein